MAITYDLEERTALFGEKIVRFCKKHSENRSAAPLINQLIRSGTSIGANYMEANGGSSKKDFKNKIYICKKESQETKHWLRMIVVSLPEEKKYLNELGIEAQELILIFQKITSSLNNKY